VKARSPGKIVLSGAYSVLEGAPALVAAVDRYVVADSTRAAVLVTDEVRTAIDAGVLPRAPWFDASALRERNADGSSRKLGLGSSAAILAACLAAVLGERCGNDVGGLRETIFPMALAAHRKAQGGGSGVDVAASVFGGILRVRRTPDSAGGLRAAPHGLPDGTVVEVFGSRVAAVTRDLLRRVSAFAEADRVQCSRLLRTAGEGAEAAAVAGSTEQLLYALAVQVDALTELGDAAGAPIVTPEVRTLRKDAAEEEAAAIFMPSGAGGGDIALWVGSAPSSVRFRERAARQGLSPVALALGAPGTTVG
jgi:phosphomevalonate kinase